MPSQLEGGSIKSAQLQIYLAGLAGTPFSNYGSVKIVPVSFVTTTAAIDLYSNCALGEAANAFTSATLNNWATMDVTNAVKADLINSREYSQFRLQHLTEAATGETSAYSEWIIGTVETANYARLVIVYIPAN